MLELVNICAGYGKKEILKDVSLSLETGKITCIIGPNGSGKSTLLRVLLGSLPVSEGSVLLDDRAVTAMSQTEFARKVAYLPQGRAVPEMTVEQLVLHGRFPYLSYPRQYRKQDREMAVQAMERMQIEVLAQQKLSELSGGMRQSAYIAMALAQNTEYILLDEPTTYLDIANQMQLMDTCRKLSDEGKGIVMVLHDLVLAVEHADRLIVLEAGKVRAQGEPKTLCASGILDSIYGIRLQSTGDGHYYYDRSLS